MGAEAFGRETRAVTSLLHMKRVRPVFLISRWEDGTVSRLLTRHNLPFTKTSFGYLGRAHPLWTLINILQMPILYVVVVVTCVKRRCRVVLVLNVHAFVNALPAILFLRFVLRRTIVFYVGDIPDDSLVSRWVARWINRTSSRVVMNSLAVKRGFLRVGVSEEKTLVVHNGVDLDKFSHPASSEKIRERRDETAEVLVGFAGQFSIKKGIEDFLLAAEMVAATTSRCRFVLVGKLDKEVAYHQYLFDFILKHHLQEYVRFAGWTDRIESVYAQLHMLVVPSRYEDPAPNVNIEAMASGLPVIATRVGGTPEIVRDGETGFLVDRHRPDQLAACITRLANDDVLRERLGDAGKKRALELFDITKSARKVEDVLLRG